jgi:hypothetical protein
VKSAAQHAAAAGSRIGLTQCKAEPATGLWLVEMRAGFTGDRMRGFSLEAAANSYGEAVRIGCLASGRHGVHPSIPLGEHQKLQIIHVVGRS